MNYKKMSKLELLTSIYTNDQFRTNYFRWLTSDGFRANRKRVNRVVLAYEYYLINQVLDDEMDAVDYPLHNVHIPIFINRGLTHNN